MRIFSNTGSLSVALNLLLFAEGLSPALSQGQAKKLAISSCTPSKAVC